MADRMTEVWEHPDYKKVKQYEDEIIAAAQPSGATVFGPTFMMTSSVKKKIGDQARARANREMREQRREDRQRRKDSRNRMS